MFSELLYDKVDRGLSLLPVKGVFMRRAIFLVPFGVVGIACGIVNFDQSMYGARFHAYQTFKDLYDKNNFERVSFESVPIIPKKIHQIWLGPRPLPECYKVMVATWQQKHPDWEYKMWGNEDIKSLRLDCQALFNRLTNWGAKSDILRYEILYQYGGVYVDVDIDCMKPFDVLHHTSRLYVGLEGATICNALIGAVPGHPLLRACLDELKKIANAAILDNPRNVCRITGPDFFTRMFLVHVQHDSDRIIAYPCNFFYPFPFTGARRFWAGGSPRDRVMRRYVRPETFAIHYWSGSWR